jgi:dipeptidyl aminopeptidase/acylaminoacyl peptidase
MVKALKAKNIDVEYITFADEGHGFRQAENIKQLYEKELAFYQRLLRNNGDYT